MDITSVIGLFGAGAIVIVTIFLEGGNPLSYLNLPAALTAIGGAGMATFLAYPVEDVKKLAPAMKKLFANQVIDLAATVDRLVQMCTVVRRDGLLALDGLNRQTTDPFLSAGTGYVMDGMDPELLKTVLLAEISARKHRHSRVRGMFDFMGNVAPGFALVGTLLGLVAMLANLNPSEVGHRMSLALLCTLYGCGIANAVFMPVAKKLGVKSDEEIFYCHLVLEGLLMIQRGENPRALAEALRAYLPAELRSRVGSSTPARAEAA